MGSMLKSFYDPVGDMLFGKRGAAAPAPAPVTSANQERLAADTAAQVTANDQIAADKKRRKAGSLFTSSSSTDTATTSTATAVGKTTLGQ